MLPLLSKLNHACNANMKFQVTEGSPHLDVIALRDVEAGEELTINYVMGDLSLAERQQKLREIWFFDCRCVKCRLQEAQTERSRLRVSDGEASEESGRSSLCCFDCT